MGVIRKFIGTLLIFILGLGVGLMVNEVNRQTSPIQVTEHKLPAPRIEVRDNNFKRCDHYDTVASSSRVETIWKCPSVKVFTVHR